MTRTELKTRLLRYQEIKKEIVQIKQEITTVEERMYSLSSPSFEGIPHSSTPGDPTGNKATRDADKHSALLESYARQIERLTTEQAWIETQINCLEPVLRRLMRYRYIDGMIWEDVCDAISYSWRQTLYMHSKALDILLERLQ